MHVPPLLVVMATMLPPLLAQPKTSSALRCVEFATAEALKAGESFTAPLEEDLEFRLKPWEKDAVWLILVGPKDSPLDYLWIASPPFRTAPHRQIGAGFGLTAEQSASMTPRRFRFVTGDAAYERALALYESAGRGAAAPVQARDFEALGAGTLELSIAGFGVAGEELAWIKVKGKACLPG